MGCALCVRGCALIVSSVSFHGNIKIIIEQVKKLHYCAMSDVSPVYCARCSGPTCPVRKIRNPYAATYDPVWITVDPKPEHAELTVPILSYIHQREDRAGFSFASRCTLRPRVVAGGQTLGSSAIQERGK